MKKQTIIKILITIFLAISILIIISNTNICLALGDVAEDWGNYKPTIQASKSLDEKVGSILSVIRAIGIVVSIVTLMGIGIKFMVGSADEKANYKQALMPWLIGAIMVFAITTLPSLIYNLTNSTFN